MQLVPPQHMPEAQAPPTSPATQLVGMQMTEGAVVVAHVVPTGQPGGVEQLPAQIPLAQVPAAPPGHCTPQEPQLSGSAPSS